MDATIDQLPCGIVLIDEAGNIVTINTTAEQQLTYARGELVGRPFSDLLTPAGQMLYQTHIYPLVNLHGRIDEAVLTLITQTSTRIPVLFNAVRQFQNGQWFIHGAYLPLGQRHSYETELIQTRQSAEQARLAVEASESQYRTLAADLEARVMERTNELEAANARLTQVNTDLRRSNENLQQFAYIASHDLQEPLRKIQSFSDILKTQYTDQLGNGTDYLQRMQDAASRMSALIRDLLAFSRISTRQEAAAPVSLTPVVQQVVTDLDLLIQETGAVVTLNLLPTVLGDASQLGQLFQNLLNNALKFRRANVPPLVAVRAERVAATALPPSVKPTRTATTYHRIDVVDNGVGFDDKYVDRIFQVFQRLHGRNEFAGTGIGLAICEKVAANHGGSITASSQPGQGATFSVYLPA